MYMPCLISSVQSPKLIAAAAYLCHGMVQLSTLVELDIGGNAVPEELQPHLQVSTINGH